MELREFLTWLSEVDRLSEGDYSDTLSVQSIISEQQS